MIQFVRRRTSIVGTIVVKVLHTLDDDETTIYLKKTKTKTNVDVKHLFRCMNETHRHMPQKMTDNTAGGVKNKPRLLGYHEELDEDEVA